MHNPLEQLFNTYSSMIHFDVRFSCNRNSGEMYVFAITKGKKKFRCHFLFAHCIA